MKRLTSVATKRLDRSVQSILNTFELIEFGRVVWVHELFDIVDNNINMVAKKDAMTYMSIFLNTNVKNTSTSYQLLVNRQRLALCERARNEWDSNLISCRIMCTYKDS
ncbi:hypothetical protein H5410_052569 [Solanum commersonii]|uniref:Uncharacterized protein n=1 Tax=Solanum commersonii TaxID=4109 RepID=A0A9J5X3Z5_SOLCO|nr:hypothetical protein H5410_052569 [Solanum commersonii]